MMSRNAPATEEHNGLPIAPAASSPKLAPARARRAAHATSISSLWPQPASRAAPSGPPRRPLAGLNKPGRQARSEGARAFNGLQFAAVMFGEADQTPIAGPVPDSQMVGNGPSRRDR